MFEKSEAFLLVPDFTALAAQQPTALTIVRAPPCVQ